MSVMINGDQADVQAGSVEPKAQSLRYSAAAQKKLHTDKIFISFNYTECTIFSYVFHCVCHSKMYNSNLFVISVLGGVSG